MSDLFDGKTNVSADEPTKTMPAVDAQAQPTVRHRRSDRKPQSAEKEEVKLTGSDPVSYFFNGKPSFGIFECF